jgi:4-alpha-glucanotransferase
MRTRFSRSSGILLHPTSLPGTWGIGDFGAAAYEFVDFLVSAGQSLWQILPLNPTGFGDSPYQSPSAFAGNQLLISPDKMLEDGLLQREDLYDDSGQPIQTFSPDKVDYDAVCEFKWPLLRKSFARFRSGAAPAHQEGFARFCQEQADWLDDYALFISIKDQRDGASLDTWDKDIRLRDAATLERLGKELADEVEFRKYVQYLFFSQWFKLKNYANEHGIKIIGDAPIFVAYDSAEVWANEELFYLDENGKPIAVAGVPPDFFSSTGQRWGNPLYRWNTMAQREYAWWVRRIKFTLTTVDILRLDHFRGFEAYWEVPASEDTAINGRWVPGPGAALFQRLDDELGELPIIAEDLGIITEEVEALRDQFHLPGMKVLQFAFGDDATNPYLPHNYDSPNVVVYTGTHDNDTTVGWYNSLGEEEKLKVRNYVAHDGSDIAWYLMRTAFSSIADMAVVPLQDPLRLGSEARMNVPGVTGGNWDWRFRSEMLTPQLAEDMRNMTATYRRLP